MPEALSEILKEDGYYGVRVFVAVYCKTKAMVERYDRSPARQKRKAKQSGKPPIKTVLPPKGKKRDRLKQIKSRE